MIQDIDNINVSIQDDNNVNVTVENDSITVNEGTPTDIAEIMHNEQIRQENEAQRIANEEQRIANEEDREEYIADLKQRVLDGEFNGEDGFSPIANVSKSGDTATITITDKTGTTTATISDGEDGQDGQDGQDGFSPSASVTKSGSVATITITDKSGTTTANVYDGTGSGGIWGSITGTLSDQTDLQNALDEKQNVMQYTTMPPATSSLANKIAQYVGTDNTTYSPFSFYICKETSIGSGVYEWLYSQVDDLTAYQTKIDSSHKLYSDLVTDAGQTNKFLTTGVQTITGTKTFMALPQYYYDLDPVLDNELITKAYVDNNFEYQKTSLPTASADFYGSIFQYVGATNANYTNGYFYKCVRSGTSPNYTYSWERTDVQPKADLFTPTYNTLTTGAQNDPIILDELEPGIYYNNDAYSSIGTRYIKLSSTYAAITYVTSGNMLLVIPKRINASALENKETVAVISDYSLDENTSKLPSNVITPIKYNTSTSNISLSGQYRIAINGAVSIIGNQTINGKKTFNTLPESSTTPTTNNQLTNKSYVDSGLSGKQATIDSSHKLSADLVDDSTSTNKFFSGSYTDLSNKPTIPDELADLSDDSTHRVVTDTEKTTWSGKQDALVSGTTIKTINSTSLLGSGNIDVGADIPQQDTAPSNPQENDLWIDTDEPGLTQIDSVVSTTSTNPIENQAITNYVNSINEYSTEETKVGTWINGKPIYRKVFTQTSIGNIATGITNWDDIVKMEMLIRYTNSTDWRNVPWLFSYGSSYGDASWAGGFYFNNGTISFQMGTNLDDVNKVILIMEYTKTTD